MQANGSGFCLGLGMALAQEPDWVRRYNGTGQGTSIVNALTIDSFGDIYVTGWSQNHPVSLKYNPQGDLLWERRYTQTTDGQTVAAALDKDENLIVVGYAVSPSSGSDFLILKYRGDGSLLWEQRYNGPANSTDRAQDVAVDSLGNVYVTGWSSRSAELHYDYLTLKYDGTDGRLLWERRYGGPTSHFARFVRLDARGNVYVSGIFWGSVYFEWATLKYSSEGNEEPEWVRRYSGTGQDHSRVNALTIDSWGDVYVTGSTFHWPVTLKYNSQGDLYWERRYTESTTGETLAAVVDKDDNLIVVDQDNPFGYGRAPFMTLKYSWDGTLIWERRPDSGLSGRDVAVDSLGNIYVSGIDGGQMGSCLTLKYDSEGSLLRERRYDGPHSPRVIRPDRDGNVYVSGISRVPAPSSCVNGSP